MAASLAVRWTRRAFVQDRSAPKTCEITEDDIVGAAVNLAARIQTAAAPGEILVSSTMRELTAGANLEFEDRGEQLLKGFDEPWRLWALKV